MLEYILFAIGFVLLLKGADYLVEGSSALAKKLGVSNLVIGLTVVAFGTSLPELVVNIFASISGNGNIAFGNIIGSNIANIALILGVCGAIAVISVSHSTVWKEIPYSFLAAIVLLLFAMPFFFGEQGLGFIFRIEGVILICFFAIFLYYVFRMAKRDRSEASVGVEIEKHSGAIVAIMIIAGLAALFVGGKWVVDGAVAIARLFGMSEYFISLTIVAIGTSLPELVTSVTAALKKKMDLAVGNIVGSNIFNIFWILGISSIITPIKFPEFAVIDLAVLLFISALLFAFMFLGTKHKLDRWQGFVFVGLYAIYLVYLVLR